MGMKLLVFLLAMILAPSAPGADPDFGEPGKATAIHFDPAPPVFPSRAEDVQYDFDLARETFEVFVPANYSGQEPFGIFAFIAPENKLSIPRGWYPLLEKNHLIGLIPQRIGNNQGVGRRLGLTLTGILKLEEHFKIDHKRIITSGFSGGARCALHLAFVHGDVITGSIAIGGADFYEPVPQVKARDSRGYGVWPAPADSVARARTNVVFALITGSKDPLRGNIQDIYEWGFVKKHFQARLFDIPGFGHELPEPRVLQKAITYIDETLRPEI